MLPRYPNTDTDEGQPYDIDSIFDMLVAEYANISIFDVQELDADDYLYLRREAFIYRLSQTEKGIEYLKNAWRLEQTEPDRPKLREKFGVTEMRV